MNSQIKSIFTNFTVDGKEIPVCFLHYDGDKDTYIVYMEWDKDNAYGADDEIAGYVTYYDFDIYSKGNYLNVIQEVKNKLELNGWIWQPSRDSSDMYDTDTGYYHKTVCFAYQKQI